MVQGLAEATARRKEHEARNRVKRDEFRELLLAQHPKAEQYLDLWRQYDYATTRADRYAAAYALLELVLSDVEGDPASHKHMKYRGQDIYEIAQDSDFYVGEIKNTSSVLAYDELIGQKTIVLEPTPSHRRERGHTRTQASISHRVAGIHGIDRASWIFSHAT